MEKSKELEKVSNEVNVEEKELQESELLLEVSRSISNKEWQE